jgi:hypothetical protein
MTECLGEFCNITPTPVSNFESILFAGKHIVKKRQFESGSVPYEEETPFKSSRKHNTRPESISSKKPR